MTKTLRLLLPLTLMVLSTACSLSAPANRISTDIAPAASDELFVLIGEADRAYRQKRWSDASQLYQRVVNQQPQEAYLWMRLGNSLTQQGLYREAIQAFEVSLQQDQAQAKPWFNLSTTHLLAAQVAALQAWDIMEESDPDRDQVERRLEDLGRLLY